VTTKGPIDLLRGALRDLDEGIEFRAGVATSTHTVVVVDGLERNGVPAALGRYLVGALAGAVGLDARLSDQLLARGVDRRAEVGRTVASLVGKTNDFTTQAEIRFRDTRRNAWIGEGVGHALLMLTAQHETSSVNGLVCTLSEVHQTPTRQGLDSVSTYVQAGVLGVAIGESKTTLANPSGQLSDAIGVFAEVEEGIHGPDLRARLAAFRGILPTELMDQVTDALWSTNASYLPMIVHEDEFDFMSDRPSMARLAQPRERRRVIVVRLASFNAFFDDVADAMRAAVEEVVS